MVRPPMVGPTMSIPSMEDLDGFDRHYGDGPTPIISAAPQQTVRVRPLTWMDKEPSAALVDHMIDGCQVQVLA